MNSEMEGVETGSNFGVVYARGASEVINFDDETILIYQEKYGTDLWKKISSEETVYFKHRVQGPYKPIFFLNLVINFLAPLIILMKRSAKRNFTLVAFMAVLILFGHWIDFYQMVMGSLMKEHVTLGWLDFGILGFFVGVLILMVARSLASKPLIAKNHPFLKESIIHQV